MLQSFYKTSKIIYKGFACKLNVVQFSRCQRCFHRSFSFVFRSPARQLSYNTTPPWICQHLFSSFFTFFRKKLFPFQFVPFCGILYATYYLKLKNALPSSLSSPHNSDRRDAQGDGAPHQQGFSRSEGAAFQ